MIEGSFSQIQAPLAHELLEIHQEAEATALIGEAEIPRSELLALAVSGCGEEAKKEMPHW